MISRRHLMIGGFAMAVGACDKLLSASPSEPAVFPERFGAKGDGTTDDTGAIQRCLDHAPDGYAVTLRSGAVYMIRTEGTNPHARFGGIKLRSGQTLNLSGAELRAFPAAASRGAVILAENVRDWRIIGPGKVTGERSRHLGQDGEWGMGVCAIGCSDWSISGQVEVSDCWGDGIYVGAADRAMCDRFTISGVRILRSRRNGISITGGRNGTIANVEIRDVNGTNPAGGIDLEANDKSMPCENIRIDGCRIYGDVKVGIYVASSSRSVVIRNVDVTATNSGVIIGGVIDNVLIEGSKIRSTGGGREGAAIRSAGDPKNISRIRIENNYLSGGGVYVVSFATSSTGNLSITGNHISASNPGVLGVARLSGGTFVGNICEVVAPAGAEGRNFLSLVHALYGRNRYVNRTDKRIRAIYRLATEIAPDDFAGPFLPAARDKVFIQ